MRLLPGKNLSRIRTSVVTGMSDSSDMHREDNIVLPKSSNTDRDQLVKKRLSPRKESSLKRNVESSDPQMVR